MRRGRVYYNSELAGHLHELEHEGGMRFQYTPSWQADRDRRSAPDQQLAAQARGPL